MSSLREAMARADSFEDKIEAGTTWALENAVGRALVEVDDADPAEKREAERQAREDEYASWAMEIIMRARSRIGRTKWSATEGVVKRRIVEALRCLPSED